MSERQSDRLLLHEPDQSDPRMAMVLTADGHLVADVYGAPGQVEADARLFAAAPALLDALKWCHDALGELAGWGAEDKDAQIIEHTGNDDHAGLFAAVAAAIARATGKGTTP